MLSFFVSLSKNAGLNPGADLGFSRGEGADFQKFQKLCRPFFSVDQIDFSEESVLKPI